MRSIEQTYQLTASQAISYEWNKGPRPSGFAHLKFKLEPNKSTESMLKLEVLSEKIWRLREHPKSLGDGGLDEQVDAFMPKILKGIYDGVSKALLYTLDKPVTNVKVILEEVIIDPVYSTEMAFHFAAKSAIEDFLKQTVNTNMLV